MFWKSKKKIGEKAELEAPPSPESEQETGKSVPEASEAPKVQTRFKIDFNQKIPKLPDLRDPTQIDVRYELIPNYAYAHVYWNAESSELLYDIEEPELSEFEQKILDRLDKGIQELINISFIGIKSQDVVIQYLEKNIEILLDEFGVHVDEESFLKIMYYIYRDFVGLNEIEPMMHDFFIEDIECNGSKSPVYLVHRKFRNLKTNIVYPENKVLANFVEKLAQKCGKYVSYAKPLLDGRLPDGSRVNATYTEEISSKGPTFTIRKFTKIPWTPVHLIALRTVSAEVLAYLWLAIEYENNIMVIGGTGSGKTTLLNGISFFIPPQARIVSIEDTRELNLSHENWLPSVSREGVGLTTITGERHGEVSLFDLLKESFRQRPDYVIVGEVRGKEANVLFQGMGSGHPSFGTMHAEDVTTLIRRLETPPISLSPSLVESLNVVCIIAPVKVGGIRVRRIREINELSKVKKDGTAIYNTPFKWDPKTDSYISNQQSIILNKLITHHGLSAEKVSKEFRARTAILKAMVNNKIFDVKMVQDVINQYYKIPETVLSRFNIKV